jgi:hypothetical protein
VVAAPLAAGARAAAGSTRSVGRAPRARGRSARSARPRPRRTGDPLLDSMLHASTPPSRAPTPPRSSTARLVSEGLDLLSRSCPLRAVGSVPSAPASEPAASGSTPSPPASSRTLGWPGDAPAADAPPRTRRSTLGPMRTVRRGPASARTHDTDRIARPPAAPARSGWTRTANRRTLPHGSARPRARREGSGGQTRAFTFSMPVIYGRRPTLPSTARAVLATGPPQAVTGFQSPPRAPPRSTCTDASCSSHLIHRYDDDLKISPEIRRERRESSSDRRRHRRCWR